MELFLGQGEGLLIALQAHGAPRLVNDEGTQESNGQATELYAPLLLSKLSFVSLLHPEPSHAQVWRHLPVQAPLVRMV